jgi:peptidoglycan/xylan/chitin deacetylase (PgdA/CDA1 family)
MARDTRWTGGSREVVVFTIAFVALVAVVAVVAVVATVNSRETTTSPREAPALVTVSLTWDDGRASQAGSVRIQSRHGLTATYYVNSAHIDDSSWNLTRAELDRVVAAGNEVGGHTERHEILTEVDTEVARRTVCGDRERLMRWYGPEAGRSFAYTNAEFNSTVAGIVSECGWSSGRGVGGVQWGPDTPVAESVPPADPYAIRTVAHITERTTLATLQESVSRAERDGGGWIIYVLHGLEDEGDDLHIDPQLYDTFLGWLSAKSNVSVRTIGDVTDEVMGSTAPRQEPLATPS